MSAGRSVTPQDGMPTTTDAGHMRRTAPVGSQGLLRVAWLVTVMISAIPVIAFTELTGSVPGGCGSRRSAR